MPPHILRTQAQGGVMTEKEFELVINRMRAEMDQVMQNTAMRLSGSDLAPSMAL
jgi:hypothetical protein